MSETSAMTPGDWINVVVALASVVMAGATYYLARVTRQLATDTTDATKQADRHHQEDSRPFCMIVFPDASREFPFGSDFDPETRQRKALMASADQVTHSPALYVRGELQNKGSGPAKDIFVYLNTRLGGGEEGAFRLTRRVVASGLIGAGETTPIDVQIVEQHIMQTWDGEKWSPTQALHSVAEQTYEVVLEYKDAFGNSFRTIHSRGIWTPPVPNIGDASVRERMMTQPDRPTPIFLTGTQTVRTLADVPTLQFDIPVEDEMPEF